MYCRTIRQWQPSSATKDGTVRDPKKTPGLLALFCGGSDPFYLQFSSKKNTTRLGFTGNCNTPTRNPINFWHHSSLHNWIKITTQLDWTKVTAPLDPTLVSVTTLSSVGSLSRRCASFSGIRWSFWSRSRSRSIYSRVYIFPFHLFRARNFRP